MPIILLKYTKITGNISGFFGQGKLYQFTCLPNGLKSAPRVFTKITKVIFSTARKQNITASSYIDDVITVSEIMRQARESVKKLLSITQAAGFCYASH